MKTKLTFAFVCLCIFANLSIAQNKSTDSGQNLPKINISPKRIEAVVADCPNIEERTADVYIRIDNVPDDVESKDYKYTVSAGKIKGEGRSIFWNLDGANPGSYTITLEVNQKGKISKISETVKVVEPMCCMPVCECPRFSITSSANEVKKGETVRFRLNITGGSQNEVIIKWTISVGKILDGQGKNEIVVEADPNTKTELTATVEVDGLCSTMCPNSDSVTVKIIDK